MTPPPDLDVVQWAEKFRRLSRESSNGGKFVVSRVEVARGPMLWATEPGVRTISLMACTQLLKALDCAMEIPTPAGWTTMGEVAVGDEVFDERGQICRVVGTSDIKTGEVCFKISFSDGAEVVCDAGHLWQVDDNKSRFSTQVTRIAETREIAATFKSADRTRNRYAVPVTRPLALPDRDLPVPPYTLGAWLGDGHSASARLTLHERDAEIVDRIISEGIKVSEHRRSPTGVLTMGLDFERPEGLCRRGHRLDEAGRTSDGYCLTCSRQKAMQTKWGPERHPRDPIVPVCESLGRRLIRIGLRNAKRIPDEYLRASRGQRMALLQGLMDTDGTVTRAGRCCYTTISADLARDVTELMASLGLKPSSYAVKTRCPSRGAIVEGAAIQISFTAYAEESVFQLSRKRARLGSRADGRASETARRRIVGIEQVVSRPVRCIMVDSPSRLFLCGREMIPTHNTTVIENIVGRFVHLDPCPILAVFPKDDAAETFSKDRLAPMIRDSPKLRELFGEAKATDAGATLTHKQFEGGHITLVGSNSPTNLAMRPIRLLMCDEIDKYPASAGGEGPPIDLAVERQAEFEANALTVLACSPTIAGRSAIEASYEESDQRQPFVRCPHPGCGTWQPLEWDRVKFDKDAQEQIRPETARYECAACEEPWTEAQRLVSLRKVEWRQTRPFTCCGEYQTPERWAPEAHGVRRALCVHCGVEAVSNEQAGGVASKLYAPKQTLRNTVAKFARAMRRGPGALLTFYNTQLARTWKEGADTPEWQDVYARRDTYLSGTVSRGALILFGGVDVQKDRIEVSVWGFGRNRERWLVEHRVLPGDTGRPEVWGQLAAMFDETWEHEGAAEMAVRDWGVDSGAFTAEVYAFVRSQAGRGNVHAIDGADSYSGAFLGVGAKDANAAGKRLRRGLKTVRVGVSFAKQELMGCFALQRPPTGEAFPAGFVHLPRDVSEDGVKQLTAEELVVSTKRGRTRREWVPIGGRRNEWLDCANYARALAAMRGWDRWREAHWRDLEALLGLERSPAAESSIPPVVVANTLAARDQQRRATRRSRVVNRR